MPLLKRSPLTIDVVTTPSGAQLGMCCCPGRRGIEGTGQAYQRNGANDRAAIESWAPNMVVSLIETSEFAKLGVPQLATAMQQAPWQWLHLPIADMAIPGASTQVAWLRNGPALQAALASGERILIHCAAGLGRTGMVVAKLLVMQGIDATDAIAQVRAARPGTIETPAQAQWVASGKWGSPTSR